MVKAGGAPARAVSIVAAASLLVGVLSSYRPAIARPGPCARKAKRIVKHMRLRGRVGQMVMGALIPNADGTPSEATRRMITRHRIGSVIVFGARGPAAAARNNNAMQYWAAQNPQRVPLLIAADNEFGAAHRVPNGTTVFPLAMGIGATRRPRDARRIARIIGRESRAMGFSWSLAPVADVNTNSANPVIGVRSFGGRPSLVGNMTRAEVRGLQTRGVVATPKHFPGHGATSIDSHTGLPVVEYGRKRLRRTHLRPFREAIDAGADSIMTAHIIVRAVDRRRPATLSRKVLNGILRRRMNFRGLIVTDDMMMAAIAQHYGRARATRLAARAGADVIMVTGAYGSQAATVRALKSGVRSGAVPKERVTRAARRVIATKCRYGLFGERYVKPQRALSVGGRKKSRRIAARIARRTITVVKNRKVLPFSRKRKRRVLVTGVMHVGRLAQTARRLSRAPIDEYQTSLTPSRREVDEAVRRARRSRKVIVATYSRSALPSSQATLVKRLVETGKRVVAVSLGLPYDLRSYAKVRAYIASYAQGPWPSVTPPPLSAAIKVIFGAQPGGRLPVGVSHRYGYGRGLRYP